MKEACIDSKTKPRYAVKTTKLSTTILYLSICLSTGAIASDGPSLRCSDGKEKGCSVYTHGDLNHEGVYGHSHAGRCSCWRRSPNNDYDEIADAGAWMCHVNTDPSKSTCVCQVDTCP